MDVLRSRKVHSDCRAHVLLPVRCIERAEGLRMLQAKLLFDRHKKNFRM